MTAQHNAIAILCYVAQRRWREAAVWHGTGQSRNNYFMRLYTLPLTNNTRRQREAPAVCKTLKQTRNAAGRVAVSYWSKEIGGTRALGPKAAFFPAAEGALRSMAAAP